VLYGCVQVTDTVVDCLELPQSCTEQFFECRATATRCTHYAPGVSFEILDNLVVRDMLVILPDAICMQQEPQLFSHDVLFPGT
jgi:hypothetical protein